MGTDKRQSRNKYVATLYRLFTQTNIEEIRTVVKSSNSQGEIPNEQELDPKQVIEDNFDKKRPDNRRNNPGDRWQDSMEEQADSNTNMIFENRELLERLDERSAWTMRLLVGVFVTIIGSAALQVFVF